MKELIKRVHKLFIKVISIKGLILGLATWLILLDKLGPMEWMICALGLAGVRAYEKTNGILGGGNG